MPIVAKPKSEIDSLLKSVNSKETLEKLDSFFKESPGLQRLRDYAIQQGIKFGIDIQHEAVFLSTILRFSAMLIRSSEGIVLEKIILIPEIAVSKFIVCGSRRKWLDGMIVSFAHEIAHLETLLEISKKECKLYKDNCLYKELAANKRAWQILKKNKIRVEKEFFTRYTSAGIKTDPNYPVCFKKIEDVFCPYLR